MIDQKKFIKARRRIRSRVRARLSLSGNNVPAMCSRGMPITAERVQRHMKLAKNMIYDFLPMGRLHEAAMDIEDLLLTARKEVFLAIKDGLDFNKAINTSSKKDAVEREAHISWKKANPDEAYQQVEEIIVRGRLANWLRRVRHWYHPDQRGGRSISWDEIVSNVDSDRESLSGKAIPRELALAAPAKEYNRAQVDEDMETLLLILGVDIENPNSPDRWNDPEAARVAFFNLPKERQDELVGFLREREPVVVSQSRTWDEMIDDIDGKKFQGPEEFCEASSV